MNANLIIRTIPGALCIFVSLSVWPMGGLTEPDGGDIAFYTFGISGVLFFSIVMISMRAYIWLGYAGYGILILLMWSALDGTLAFYIGGGQQTMAIAPLLVGSVLVFYGFGLAAIRLEAPHPLVRLKMPFYFFGAWGLLLVPGLLLGSDLIPLYATLNTLMLCVVVAQIFPPLTWTTLSVRQRMISKVWPFIFATIALGIYGTHFLGEGFTRTQLDSFNRLIFFLHIGFAFSFAFIYVYQQARDRESALQSSIDAQLQTAQTNLALERSQREFEKVQKTASQRSRRLAEASHDIKQPIASLQRTIENIQREQPGVNTERLTQAVEYLDHLAGSYVDAGVSDIGKEGIDEGSAVGSGYETIAVQIFLETIERMFIEDAQARAMSLTVERNKAAVHVPPLAVIRILSNLVNNALSHSAGKSVRVAVKQNSEYLSIQVHDDGKGMTDNELASAIEFTHKDEASEGHGLGLAIVVSLAEQYGFGFNIDSSPGKGTSAYLELPLGRA